MDSGGQMGRDDDMFFRQPQKESITMEDVEYTKYRKKGVAYGRPYVPGEDLPSNVSISQPDRDYGSPKAGDMIFRNPDNYSDVWLVAADFFTKNYEPA